MNNLNFFNELINELNQFFNYYIGKIFSDKNHYNFQNLLEELKNIDINEEYLKKCKDNINELKDKNNKSFVSQNSINRNNDLKRLLSIKEKLNDIEENSLNYKIFFNEIVNKFNNSNYNIIEFPEFKKINSISDSSKIFLEKWNNWIEENNNLKLGIKKIENSEINDLNNKIWTLEKELLKYQKNNFMDNKKLEESNLQNLVISHFSKEKEDNKIVFESTIKIKNDNSYANDEFNSNIINNLKKENKNLKNIIENLKNQKKGEKFNVVYSFRDLFLNKSNISNKINNSSYINKNSIDFNNSNVILNNLVNQLVLILKDLINDYKILKNEIDNYKSNIKTNFLEILRKFKFSININKKNKIKFNDLLKKYSIDKLNIINFNKLINKLIENNLEKKNYDLILSENENLKDSYLLLLNGIKKNKNISEFSQIIEEENYFLNKDGNEVINDFKEFLNEYNKLKNHWNNLDMFYKLMIDLKEKNHNEIILTEIQNILKIINFNELLIISENYKNFEKSIINNLKNLYTKEINELKNINNQNLKNKNLIKEKIMNLREIILNN